MKTKKTLVICLAILAVISMSAGYAITLMSSTVVNFNINSVVSYTLTLPGESAMYANDTPTHSADIEFNFTKGNLQNIDPSVKGGNPQTNDTPIFRFVNTGTVNLNITVQLDSQTPSCVTLKGANTFPGANTGSNISNSSEILVVAGIEPVSTPADWYMKIDAVNCTQSANTTRTVLTKGVQS